MDANRQQLLLVKSKTRPGFPLNKKKKFALVVLKDTKATYEDHYLEKACH